MRNPLGNSSQDGSSTLEMSSTSEPQKELPRRNPGRLTDPIIATLSRSIFSKGDTQDDDRCCDEDRLLHH